MAGCLKFESEELELTTIAETPMFARYFSTIHAGAWSLAPSSPRTLRSTPAFIRRGASAGLSSR